MSQTRLTVGIGNPSPIKLRLEILELASDRGVLMLSPLIPSVSPSPWGCSYLSIPFLGSFSLVLPTFLEF